MPCWDTYMFRLCISWNFSPPSCSDTMSTLSTSSMRSPSFSFPHLFVYHRPPWPIAFLLWCSRDPATETWTVPLGVPRSGFSMRGFLEGKVNNRKTPTLTSFNPVAVMWRSSSSEAWPTSGCYRNGKRGQEIFILKRNILHVAKHTHCTHSPKKNKIAES